MVELQRKGEREKERQAFQMLTYCPNCHNCQDWIPSIARSQVLLSGLLLAQGPKHLSQPRMLSQALLTKGWTRSGAAGT